MNLYSIVGNQVRTAGFGTPYALDLSAVTVLQALNVVDLTWQITKLQLIFNELNKKEENGGS